jgi:hypothetical protein
VLYDLPDPAIITTGPGGDYDKAVSEEDLIRVMKTARDIVGKTWLAIGDIIDAFMIRK